MFEEVCRMRITALKPGPLKILFSVKYITVIYHIGDHSTTLPDRYVSHAINSLRSKYSSASQTHPGILDPPDRPNVGHCIILDQRFSISLPSS